MAVGLGGGEAFVPEMDGKAGFFAKNVGKRLGFGRLWT